MNLKAGVDCAEASVITIAGQERFIPLLAMRQNRVVVPLLLRVLPVIEAASVRTDENGVDVFPPPEKALAVYSEDTLGALTTIVFTALTRAYDLTLDEFLDLPISTHDLLAAVPAVTKQTAFFKPREPGKSAGETGATS